MKGNGLALVVVVALSLLPSAHALNCTLYYGNQHRICTNVNPLPISESDKRSLLQSNVYGTVTVTQEPINLEVSQSTDAVQTTEQLYNQNISTLVKIAVFLLLNYALFSFLTKPQKIIQWLHVAS